MSSLNMNIGDTILHYRIVGKLGEGGMGEVYHAHDLKLDRPVALKILSPGLSQSEEFRQRFRQEAKTAASIDHPNVIRIYEVGEHNGAQFLAMQYIDGMTLGVYSQANLLGIDEIINLAISICDGLQAAHDRGIIHRDLKPGNVMVDKARMVHLLDFGLARIARPEQSSGTDETVAKLSQAGYPIGTLAYMSPEQLRGELVETRSDIFALGMILYELATRSHPFRCQSPAETISRILTTEPPSVLELNPHLPADLARIIRRCLKKDPARRFSTARDVRLELEDLKDFSDQPESESLQTARVIPSANLIEREFVLTADLIRRLQNRAPTMIGDHMTYLDNGRSSDTITILLHGLGLDQRSLADVVADLPCRAIAPSLYGFGEHAGNRIPLTVSDHSILLRALFASAISRAQASRILLVGVSSGSDHCLSMLNDDPAWTKEISGLLLIGPNIDLRTCFNSRLYAELIGDTPSQLLSTIKTVTSSIDTLSGWLLVNAYQVQVLEKFGTNIAALRQYAADILTPFQKRGRQQLIDWYLLSTGTIPHVRFVFFKDELEPLNDLLQLHLEEGVLGDKPVESVIVREDLQHMQIHRWQVVAGHVRAMLKVMG